MEKFLGSTKITGKGNIRLIKDVADILKAKDGDHIIFYEENGKIIIKKA
jgi:bifunctional DNA-binding transcriptional regulator/antitoxin component of YhaV-PrlF toxin-antitoxin module